MLWKKCFLVPQPKEEEPAERKKKKKKKKIIKVENEDAGVAERTGDSAAHLPCSAKSAEMVKRGKDVSAQRAAARSAERYAASSAGRSFCRTGCRAFGGNVFSAFSWFSPIRRIRTGMANAR